MSNTIPSPEVEKRPVESILEDSTAINTSLIADEIFAWLISNVENYVDNQTKLYKLDLIVNSSEMPETKRLQNLYGAIPDDAASDLDASDEVDKNTIDACEKCRRELDKITQDAFDEIKEHKDKLDELFTRMIFFYEKIILNPESKRKAIKIDDELKSLILGKEDAPDEEKKKIQEQIVKLIQEAEASVKYEEYKGSVSVTKFEYEAFTVGVQLKATSNPERDATGEIIEMLEEPEVVKDYIIPEGFVVWLEIGYKHKQRPTAMF